MLLISAAVLSVASVGAFINRIGLENDIIDVNGAFFDNDRVDTADGLVGGMVDVASQRTRLTRVVPLIKS